MFINGSGKEQMLTVSPLPASKGWGREVASGKSVIPPLPRETGVLPSSFQRWCFCPRGKLSPSERETSGPEQMTHFAVDACFWGQVVEHSGPQLCRLLTD